MAIKPRHLSRRKALRGALAAWCSLSPAVAAATAHQVSGGPANMNALISALKTIGKPVCLVAAKRLEASGADAAGFDLHLRRAGLDAADARLLADALRWPADRPGPALRSFSASYNRDLTDAGARALAEAFPATMTELGLVDCAIGDAGGEAILDWARTAAGPRMICVEDNAFSADLRSQFARLGRTRGSLLVVA